MADASNRFDGKGVLLTGGGTGIGRAAALAFAEEGARVWIVGRREQPLQEVADLYPDRIHPLVCNIAESAKFEQSLDSITSPLDAYVGNAAVSKATPVDGSDPKAWDEVLSVNLHGNLRSCLSAAARLRDGGRIVNVTSVHGQICERGSTAYGVAKSAINQLTRCLAVELAPRGILANAVAPGFVDTPMSVVGGVSELETEWFRANFIENGRIPLRRAAQPGEIARLILFLASNENTYMTGQILTADGGLTLTL